MFENKINKNTPNQNLILPKCKDLQTQPITEHSIDIKFTADPATGEISHYGHVVSKIEAVTKEQKSSLCNTITNNIVEYLKSQNCPSLNEGKMASSIRNKLDKRFESNSTTPLEIHIVEDNNGRDEYIQWIKITGNNEENFICNQSNKNDSQIYYDTPYKRDFRNELEMERIAHSDDRRSSFALMEHSQELMVKP